MSDEREDGRILKPAKDAGPPQPGNWDDFERLLAAFAKETDQGRSE